MYIKKVLIFLFIACSLLQPVLGAWTYGVRDCGQWINRKKDAYSELAITGWLAGYMSGLSQMHALNGRKDDPLKKATSADQIFLWMDNYCQKNPLNDLVDGGDALFLELMKKQ
jgi:hypothetical protein